MLLEGEGATLNNNYGHYMQYQIIAKLQIKPK